MSALAHVDEALAIAERAPGTIVRFYPLLAAIEAYRTVDLGRTLRAADELSALDRTQRRWWGTIAENSAVNARANLGDVIGQLADWRAALSDMDAPDSPKFMLATLLATISDELVVVDPTVAIELGALAESGAIAPWASFATQPALTRLAAERPDDVASARERAAQLSYRETLDQVFVTIDALLAAHGRSTRLNYLTFTWVAIDPAPSLAVAPVTTVPRMNTATKSRPSGLR